MRSHFSIRHCSSQQEPVQARGAHFTACMCDLATLLCSVRVCIRGGGQGFHARFSLAVSSSRAERNELRSTLLSLPLSGEITWRSPWRPTRSSANLINTSGSRKRGRGCFVDGNILLHLQFFFLLLLLFFFFPSHFTPPTDAAVKFRSAQSVGSPREKHDLDNTEFKEVFSVQQLHGAGDVLMALHWVFLFFFSLLPHIDWKRAINMWTTCCPRTRKGSSTPTYVRLPWHWFHVSILAALPSINIYDTFKARGTKTAAVLISRAVCQASGSKEENQNQIMEGGKLGNWKKSLFKISQWCTVKCLTLNSPCLKPN